MAITDTIHCRSQRDIDSGSTWKYEVKFSPELDDYTVMYERYEWCSTYLKYQVSIGWYQVYIMDDGDLIAYWLRWM